jgi:hypothetical protein
VYVHVAVVLVVVPAVPATVPMPAMVKFTLPVGVELLVTVAVRVTELPYVDGLALEATVVVVAAVVGTLMVTAACTESFLLFDPLPSVFVTVTLALYAPFAVPAGMLIVSDPERGEPLVPPVARG